jgi:hypothetical protein
MAAAADNQQAFNSKTAKLAIPVLKAQITRFVIKTFGVKPEISCKWDKKKTIFSVMPRFKIQVSFLEYTYDILGMYNEEKEEADLIFRGKSSKNVKEMVNDINDASKNLTREHIFVYTVLKIVPPYVEECFSKISF